MCSLWNSRVVKVALVKDFKERFLRAVDPYKSVLIYIKGSPDPDAIASSYALKIILEWLNKEAFVFSESVLSLAQNRMFVEALKLPVSFCMKNRGLDSFDSYVVVDHQSAYIKGISELLPCILHLDHHEPIDEKEIEIVYKKVNTDAGSVSTMIGLLIQELQPDWEEDQFCSLSTSLLFGIKTDTDKYEHATVLDYRALYYLAQFAYFKLLKKISETPISSKTVINLWKAFDNIHLYKKWLISGIGYLNKLERDSIAIIADILLVSEKPDAVVVFALIEEKSKKELILNASFRTSDSDLDLNKLIKKITTNGGARKYKGAYQIDLSYFLNGPNRRDVWKLARDTTIKALENSRDELEILEPESDSN